MAKRNSVNSGRGVMYEGKMISPKLLKKKLARYQRELRKSQLRIPYTVAVDQKSVANLKYLLRKGLING